MPTQETKTPFLPATRKPPRPRIASARATRRRSSRSPTPRQGGQHRGRIFLPFADEDPKTAEIVSKVLLLARDAEIKDPNLLDQIRAAR